MSNKLCVRRSCPISKIVYENKELEDDADRILDYERFHREAELVAESSGGSRPHVHGMEDIRGNIFWAISSDASDSKVDEEIEITPEISKVALQQGFSLHDLREAEEDVV